MVPKEPVTVYRRGSMDPSGDPFRTVVLVRGEHDIATRGYLSVAIAQAARLDDADIIVDLSGVRFMDAATIDALVEAHNQMRARSRSLSVRAPSRLARRLLDVCKLSFLIEDHLALQPTKDVTAAV